MMKYFYVLLLSVVFISAANGQQRSFFNHNELAVLSYDKPSAEAGIGIKSMNGLMITNRIGLGIGLGIDKLSVSDDEMFYILPVTLHGRYVLSPQKKISFYGNFDIGYGFDFLTKEVHTDVLDKTYKGGVAVNPQVGLRFATSKKLFWTIALGYKYQKVVMEKRWNNLNVFNSINGFNHLEESKFGLNRAVIAFGLGF